MAKKMIVTALAVLAFGFGYAPRSNAGTEMIEPYGAPAPRYNYAPPPPPPRPVIYAPPPAIGIVVAPRYRVFGPGSWRIVHAFGGVIITGDNGSVGARLATASSSGGGCVASKTVVGGVDLWPLKCRPSSARTVRACGGLLRFSGYMHRSILHVFHLEGPEQPRQIDHFVGSGSQYVPEICGA